MSLYNKYRPTTPKQMVGNVTTVKSIGKSLSTGKFPHASLFIGPSGCGKTTLARMVATGGLKCSPECLYEINSANFTGVDTVRDVTRSAESRPLMGGVKVWIFDEAHMISKAGQEALLKVLEDGPEYTYFMICTTNPDKLIAAIKTRCTEYKVASLKKPEMVALLNTVIAAEGFTFTAAEIDAIAEVADGSPRAALVTLEKAATVTGADRAAAIGQGAEDPNNWEFYQSLGKGSGEAVVGHLQRYKESEIEPEAVRRIMMGIARGCLAKRFDTYALRVLQNFQFPFYDTLEPGLYLAAGNVFAASQRK